MRLLKPMLCFILFIAVISFSIVYANIKKNEIKVEKGSELLNNYVSLGHYTKSPNGEVSAEIVREEGCPFDSVFVKRQDRFEGLVALEDIFYTNIENIEWLDNIRYAIRGHVNPSLEVYILINTQKIEIIGKYFGRGFTWNKGKDRLYYIEDSLDYGQTLSKIINHEGHVYFETQPGESILDKLAVSDDEQIFVFYIDLDDSKGGSRKLIVTEIDGNKKLQKKTAIDAQFGDLEIINKTIKITSPDGVVYDYQI